MIESLQPAPVGLAGAAPVQGPEGSATITQLEDGSVELEFDNEEEAAEASVLGHAENLVPKVDERELDRLGGEVWQGWDADKKSRAEWEQAFKLGIALLGIKLEQTDKPFKGACSATHPLLIENCVKFQAKASAELLPSAGPVKTQVRGVVTEEKQQKATRVKEFMNYQLVDVMEDYYDEQERLLLYLPIFGSAFKKLYFSESAGGPVAEFIPADDFVISFNATTLQRAERYTHQIFMTENQLDRAIAEGLYADVDLPAPAQVSRSTIQSATDQVLGIQPPSDKYGEGYLLLEQHFYARIDGLDPDDEPAVPYVMTIEESTKKILSVRRNWEEDDPAKEKLIHFVHYRFVPSLGFYGMGYVHLLGNLTLASTMAMRSLLDSGQFASLQGGFKLKSFKMVGGNRNVAPGEWVDIDYMGKIGDAIMPHPYKEPSLTLLTMFDKVVGAGQKFADTTDQVIADSTNYGPVGTTMALLEASTKMFSAIHKRMHRAQAQEFKILKRLNAENLPERYPYDVVGGSREILASDFDDSVDVVPVSDPNIPSQAHKVALGQMIAGQAAQSAPGMFDMRAVNRYILNAAGVQEIDQLMSAPQQAQPRDPVSDVIAATQNQPVSAFPGQDHVAYITVFTSFISDPSIQANQTMAPALQLLAAAIKDHQMKMYLEQMAGIIAQGVQAGDLTMEQASAQAAQMVLVANQQAAQQQNGGDPMMLMAQAELKKAEAADKKVELDATGKAADAALRSRELDIREMDVQGRLALTAGANQNQRSSAELNARVKLATTTVQNLVQVAKPAPQPKEPQPSGNRKTKD